MLSAVPNLSRAQMVEVDRLMSVAYGISLIQMMENASIRLAELARQLLGDDLAGKRVAVLCGSGGNGGGGMVAARHLSNWEASVTVVLAADAGQLRGALAEQWRILHALGLIDDEPAESPTPDLILDALIGCGLTGPRVVSPDTGSSGRCPPGHRSWRWMRPRVSTWTAGRRPRPRSAPRPR